MLRSWRTTICGVIVAVAGVIHAGPDNVIDPWWKILAGVIGAVVAGVGLHHAKDKQCE